MSKSNVQAGGEPKLKYVQLTEQGVRRIPNGKAGMIYTVKEFTEGAGYFCAHVFDREENVWSLGAGDWEAPSFERLPKAERRAIVYTPFYGKRAAIFSAYRMGNGDIVGYCEKSNEWLKWREGQLHNSFGDTRLEAAALDGDIQNRGDFATLKESQS
jgi:hypothetical protein